MQRNIFKNVMTLAMTTVTAIVFAATPTHAALTGVTYVYEAGAAHGNFPDTGGVEFTDGVLAATGAFTDLAFAGFLTPDPQIKFDLGDVYDLDTIDVEYGQGQRWSPSKIIVSSSTDGTSYSSSLEFLVGNGPNDLETENLDVSSLPDGQFYRVTVERAGQWLFLSEFTFDGDLAGGGGGNGVPEPATATLALLGLGGLMMRRRRNA